jgi:hypothetical protein
VEDRLNPGLYLEMTDWAPEEYADRRVPRVLATPGVTRATWWQNVCPHRDDLPRRLPEFHLLGLFEVDESFTPPVPPPGVAGIHFRRYPRPGQGSLGAGPTLGLSLVLISPRSRAGAQALRDWADFVHIRQIAQAAVPGYTMITPYENAGGDDPLYLHLYEMDTDDPERAFGAMTARVADRLGGAFGTPAFDAWATHPELRILYVNSFRRLGTAP